MVTLHRERLAGSAKRTLGVLVALTLCLGVLVPSALAVPTGEYANFKDCPLSVSGVVTCVYSTTTGGEVKLGNTTVPIAKPIVFQGGLKQSGETTPFVPAADGVSLTKVAQTVPGGLLNIVAPEFLPPFLQLLFNEAVNHGPTGVTATTELVASPQYNFFNILTGEGPAIVLPVRVKLDNPFLGSGCYIGSSSSPITLNLTTGTTSPPLPNTPISGSLGTVSFRNEGKLVVATGDKVVDNAFAAPGANGCDGIFELLVDFAVDLKLEIPATAGHNTAILTGNLEQASAAAVRASE